MRCTIRRFFNIPYDQLPAAFLNGTIQIAMGLSAQTTATGPAPTVSFVVYNNDIFGLIMTPESLAKVAADRTPPVHPSMINSGNVTDALGPPFRRGSLVLDNSGAINLFIFSNLISALLEQSVQFLLIMRQQMLQLRRIRQRC